MSVSNTQASDSFVSLPGNPLGYVAILLALVTGVIHLLLGPRVMGFSQTLGILFILNGLGFVGGIVVGAGALLMLVVAVLGFTDPGRFSPPWGPRVVHTFAYGGFAFGTIHAAAIGTDVVGLVRPVVAPSLVFLLYVLLLRLLVLRGVAAPDAAAQ